MTDEKFLKALGKRIQGHRTKKDISVSEFAEKVNIARLHVYRIESGESAASVTLIRKIANVLDLKLKNLVDIEE